MSTVQVQHMTAAPLVIEISSAARQVERVPVAALLVLAFVAIAVVAALVAFGAHAGISGEPMDVIAPLPSPTSPGAGLELPVITSA